MLFETLLTLMPGEKLLGETNLLILGIDDAGYGKRADTLIVANINPTKNKIGVISIPRDTRVMIKGRGLDKIRVHKINKSAILDPLCQRTFVIPEFKLIPSHVRDFEPV